MLVLGGLIGAQVTAPLMLPPPPLRLSSHPSFWNAILLLGLMSPGRDGLDDGQEWSGAWSTSDTPRLFHQASSDPVLV